MKKAIAIHGNLRTFLMPTRGNGSPLYENFLSTIINPNLDENLDVYISTDVNDFYYDGYQYYTEGNNIECVNGNSFRLYDRIKIVTKKEAKEIIESELRRIIPNIRYLNIEENLDPEAHPSYSKLISCGRKGISAEGAINQNYKIWDLHRAIEKSGNIYDAILRIRFDLMNSGNFNLAGLNFSDSVIYVPGTKGILCYDWYMAGNHKNMGIFMSMYDRLAYTTDYPTWLLNCGRCGVRTVDESEIADPNLKGISNGNCKFCNSPGCYLEDVTIANEHHIGRQASLSDINPAYPGVHTHVYRYDEVHNDSPQKLEEILSSSNLKGSKFVNYGVDPSVKGERIL